MTDLLIDSQQVESAFLDCLYNGEEVAVADSVPEDAVIVEGIQNRFAFHPGRLEQKRNQVIEWLKALPCQFRKNKGEGSSFLNACNQENGVQWTGFHRSMDQLFCLGMGLGLVKCQFPRNVWSVLPGGLPYYVIDV